MANTSQQVRVGIIGVGIGQAHIRGYSQVENARVVALCDINEERARQVARDCSVLDADILSDHRALLERDDIDAVSVCLPNKLHRPVAVDALEAGKHVLCEKPLALDAREAQEIADAAQKAGKKCMVAQVKRFSPEAQLLKKLVDGGELGPIYYAKSYWFRKRGIPGYGGWFTTKSLSGGGPLIDIGVHLLDAAWWLAGCPRPLSAFGATYAEFGPQGRGIGAWSADKKPEGTFDVEDLAVALIRFEGGLTINLEVSWALHAAQEKQSVELYGREGGVEWSNKLSLVRDLHGAPATSKIEVPRGDAWGNEMRHFINCITHDTTPDPDARQGVVMMKMLESIYASAASGHEVVID
jgi:predicted dehydrogenase